MGSSKRFSLMNLMRSTPKYTCEKCKVTVHDIEQWLEHLGHDPVADALVLQRTDSWVNEHPAPDDDPEHESYFDEADSASSGGSLERYDNSAPVASPVESPERSRSSSLISGIQWLRRTSSAPELIH